MFRYIPMIGPRKGWGSIEPGGNLKPLDPDWPRDGWPGCDGKGVIIEGHGGG